MQLALLALHDEKVGAFMTPFFAQSIGAAVRAVADLVNGNREEPPRQHPEDFRLFHLGWWDDGGRLSPLEQPELVVECVNLRKGVE